MRKAYGLHGAHYKAMKGQWPMLDEQGNTDTSEGPEGEDPQEQEAGKPKDPPHGMPREMAREEELDMAEATALARIAELDKKYETRLAEREARVAELEKREVDREARVAVED